MQKLAVIFVLLCLVASAQSAPFSDVSEKHIGPTMPLIRPSLQVSCKATMENLQGNRQLNRFQMAVITSNMLDYFSKGQNPHPK